MAEINNLPPASIEAEEAILGGILFDPEAITRVAELVVKDGFYVKAHQEIYQAALALNTKGKPTDFISISTYLSDRDLLERVGGTAKLAQLLNRTVSAVNIDRYAKLIMEKYIRRQLIVSGNEIVDLGYDNATELELVLDSAEQKIFRLTQERPQEGLVPIAETLVNTFNTIEELHQETALPGIPTGYYDLDAMTSGFSRSDLIIIAGRPSMGKCLAADSQLVCQDGSVKTIEEIYHTQQDSLLTLQSDWKFDWTKPSAFIDDGIKPVYRVTTRLGRKIETTLTHPFLTIEGWRSLGMLRVGNRIAVPRRIEVFGDGVISEAEVESIADVVGNGKAIANVAQRRQDAEEEAEVGVIPRRVFSLKLNLIALFLNRLFATDGWGTVLESGQWQLGYATVSEKLARQIQHLLLRFGVITALKDRGVKYENESRQVWQLDIIDVKSIKNFIDRIGIFGKEDAIEAVKEAISSKRDPANKELNLANEVYWDEIVSIEYIGKQQVYDLTIPETHNFVANDICVHNTAFSLCVASNIARDSKLPVAVFSLEMSREQLTQRLLSSEAKIPSNRLRSGRIAQNEFGQLISGVESLSALPIYIDDTANLTVMQMRSQVRRLQAQTKDPLGLVMIDYLQLMEGGDNDNRVQQLSKMTRSLKGLARELNVPIVALSQLSRGVEQRTNKRPMLSDLRESGSIEQDADLVMMIYRDEYYNPDTPDRGITEVSIVKHRNGPVGTIKLLFNAELTKFESLAKPGGY
ncbi:replicative DNA helicase [Waterburya agarophytonicola K14]|uniref:Replicative DNA helicase n=1 Tax=Waterburya agarophytonicola KI4 TaxID=2874699 RepID=A0A964BTM1_9CYAN|nr:replicative DNA helicase [Waterburya agarophytonicola]MCC0178283.1 replicative DNA helicase [Waterburya agarophytonicola KI4]